MAEVSRYEVLLSLGSARFDEVVADPGARPYVSADAPPVKRARELLECSG